MATDIVQSLFGLDPYQTQMQQQDALRQQAAAYANMAPAQRAAMSLYQAGGQLAGAGAEGLFGMVDPAVEQAKQRQQAMSGVDFGTPESIMAAAQRVQDPKIRLQLSLLAQQKAEKRQKMQLEQAHANYYLRGGVGGGNVSAQMSAKIAIARNDAMKTGAALGYSGQDLIDFVDNAEYNVRKAYGQDGQSSVPGGPVRLSDRSAMDIVGGVTPAMRDAMIKDAEERGDTEAVRVLSSIPVSKLDVLPQSKAQVAGDVERAKQGEKIVEVVGPDGKARFASAGQSIGSTPAQYSPAIKGSMEAATTGAKGAAEVNLKDYSGAQNAVRAIPKIDNLIAKLESGDVTTGVAADFRLNLAKIKALVSKSFGGEAGVKNATDTELANVMMGGEVFPLIQALGIGARGMDTPAERDFMRKVLTGELSLEKGTLLEMARIRRKTEEDNLARYNQRREKGELDEFFKNTGFTNEPFMLPKPAPKTPTRSNW